MTDFRNRGAFLSGLGFVVFFALFVYDLLTPSVFIEDVHILGSQDPKGGTGAALLQSALDQMADRTLRRMNVLNSENNFLEMYDLVSPGFEVSHVCEKNSCYSAKTPRSFYLVYDVH